MLKAIEEMIKYQYAHNQRLAELVGRLNHQASELYGNDKYCDKAYVTECMGEDDPEMDLPDTYPHGTIGVIASHNDCSECLLDKLEENINILSLGPGVERKKI